jgi:hypothetical protein
LFLEEKKDGLWIVHPPLAKGSVSLVQNFRLGHWLVLPYRSEVLVMVIQLITGGIE